MHKRWDAQWLLLALMLMPCQAIAQPSFHPRGSVVSNKDAVDSFNAGVQLMNANKPVEAAEKFRRSIQLSADFADAHGNLGTALFMQGDMQAARSELEQAVELKPTSAPAWATLGSCYQALGMTKKAVVALQKCLAVDPHGEMAPKVHSLLASLETELQRTGGVADNGSDYLKDAVAGGLARWSSMPVHVYIKAGSGVPGFRDQFVEILKQAYADWAEASQGKLEFKYIDEPDKAQISCSWTDSARDGVSAVEGGHTVVIPDGKGGIVSATMTLLTLPATGTELSPEYALRVDLHEIGHALGILGHSRNAGDVMFASVPPGNKIVALTDRDKSTVVALYGEEATRIARKGLDTSKLISGDPTTTLNRVLVLNNEAKEALDKGNVAAAVEKLEAAHKLDPTNQLVCTNLGSAYGNMGTMAALSRNFTQADSYYKRAIPLLQHGANKMNLAAVLKNYASILRATNRAQEAAKIDGQLRTMGAQ